MALVVNTHLDSINGQKNLSKISAGLSIAMQRLSSGVRVNNAKDDAAGLAIADRMTSQVRGMTVAARNTYDGISLTQTAEGALGSLTDTLQRMRDLAVQSANAATVSGSDREKMQTEFQALNDELLRIVQNTEFNGKKILNGDLAGGLDIQVGSTTDANSRIKVTVSNMTTLLMPVTQSKLYLKVNAISVRAANEQLQAAKDAATLANAAVVATELAKASPNNIDLVKAASTANLVAAKAIAKSTANILVTTQDNKAKNRPVSKEFLNSVTAAKDANSVAADAIGVIEGSVQGLPTTDLNQASLLWKIAEQLAVAAGTDVGYATQNVNTILMNSSDSFALEYALSSINSIDSVIAAVDIERSNLGSTQNRFTTTISNLQNGIENQSAARSRIMDTDFAQETAVLARSQILQQAGTAMLAQANQSGQSVMTLLR